MASAGEFATLYEGVGSVKRHFGCTSHEGSFFSSPERIFSLSFSCCISTKARFVNPAVETGSTNHLFGHRTSDHDSFFRRRDRSREQGAQSAERWTRIHQGGPRAALPANQLRVICSTTQHPVH